MRQTVGPKMLHYPSAEEAGGTRAAEQAQRISRWEREVLRARQLSSRPYTKQSLFANVQHPLHEG